MFLLRDEFYGSLEGGWLYPLINGNTGRAPTLGLTISGAVLTLLLFTWRYAARCPVLAVVLWLALGSWAQYQMRALAPFPDATVVSSTSNGFCRESKNHPPGKLLSDFQTLAPHLDFHVRANMVGKVLFYHLIRLVSEEPHVLVWLVFAASNVGALLAYAVVWELYRDRVTATGALALYLFLPSKVFFLPLLNAVTPVFILLPLWLLLRYLTAPGTGRLLALGAALYALVLFEPLPLVTGLVFLALIARAGWTGTIGRRHVVALLGLVPATFFLVNLLVWLTCGYEIVSAFLFALHDAREFNAQQNRPYDVWVRANLTETLVNTGVLTSALVLALGAAGVLRALWAVGLRYRGRVRAVLAEPTTCLALATLATLAAVDLMGVNRGETVRLWIFLGAFLQLPVAGFCGPRPLLLGAVLVGSIMQACIGLQTRGFIMCG